MARAVMERRSCHVPFITDVINLSLYFAVHIWSIVYVLKKPLPAAFCHFSCATAHFPHILTTTRVSSVTLTRTHTHSRAFVCVCTRKKHFHLYMCTQRKTRHEHRHRGTNNYHRSKVAAAAAAPPNQCANNKAVNFLYATE